MNARRLVFVGAILAASVSASMADAQVAIGVGIGPVRIGIGGPVYYRPYPYYARYYYAPPRVYVAPSPVVVRPRVVYVNPAPMYAVSPSASVYVQPAPVQPSYQVPAVSTIPPPPSAPTLAPLAAPQLATRRCSPFRRHRHRGLTSPKRFAKTVSLRPHVRGVAADAQKEYHEWYAPARESETNGRRTDWTVSYRRHARPGGNGCRLSRCQRGYRRAGGDQAPSGGIGFGGRIPPSLQGRNRHAVEALSPEHRAIVRLR